MFAKILRQQFAGTLKGGLTTAADDVDFKLKTAANKGWFKRPGHSKASEVVIVRLLAGPICLSRFYSILALWMLETGFLSP